MRSLANTQILTIIQEGIMRRKFKYKTIKGRITKFYKKTKATKKITGNTIKEYRWTN